MQGERPVVVDEQGTGSRTSTGLFVPTRDRALAMAWLLGATVVIMVCTRLFTRQWMMDAHTYWDVWRVTPMYGAAPNTPEAYLYSPAFAQLIGPLTTLPWWIFSALWLVAALSAYTWLVAPVGWFWGIPLLALAFEDMTIGNTAWILALACVLGMRWPAAWAVPILMKITVGLGLVWFLVRRDYRSLAIAVTTTATVAIVSALTAPDLWREWFAFLAGHSSTPALYVRVILAVLLVVHAARTDRPWLLPVAMYVATPVLMAYGLGMLCAIPRLLSAEALARARAPFGPPSAFLRRLLDLPAG